MESFHIKKDLLLGVATAATQIEGGRTDNNWHDWHKRGKIRDGASPERANNHYILYEDDITLMASMGIQTYRFGIEWSRIEPQQGNFSNEALVHYRREILLMKKSGILPLITLHHFNNPMWFEKKGGFKNPDSPEIFLNFTTKVVEFLGDTVSEYITVNEPNVYASFSYYYGNWPPGEKSFSAARKVMKNLSKAHILTYSMIHRTRSKKGYHDSKVSFANHVRVFEPKCRFNPLHRFFRNLVSELFQDGITKTMSTGEKSFATGKLKGIPTGKYYDFIAVNYYTRSTVSGFGDGVKKKSPVNDLGWEIYPEGIIRCMESLYRKFRAPIYITENGTCDENDIFRSKFIYDHLRLICESELPVKRYYHWTFIDNFEWAEGETARFGLVYNNFETQERKIKKSGYFYSEIIKEGKVTEDLYKKYVKGEKYNIPGKKE